jgi:hypothetical protein
MIELKVIEQINHLSQESYYVINELDCGSELDSSCIRVEAFNIMALMIKNEPTVYFTNQTAPIPFVLGAVVLTQDINELIHGKHEMLKKFVDRHYSCDWGSICKEDSDLNDEATHNGDRIMSQYDYDDIQIWIITESDRSVTTVLLPSEY